MPSSCQYGKHKILSWFSARDDITSILDVGCGQGTYPQLLGVDKYDWYGIEIWAPYIEQFNLNSLYKKIIVGDFLWVSDDVYFGNNCVIFGDVLEHQPEKDKVMTKLKSIIYKTHHVVISVPLSDDEKYEGREHYGNPFDAHKSYFYFQEMKDLADWEIAEEEKQIGVFIK
jgi:2-polyprenyl-3-methyl-5-hydroxy-6-metoxy-1,4-benzoquinol methylase